MTRRQQSLLNRLIDKLPVELHLPGGFRYCGPGTRRWRFEANQPGINKLDVACKRHDISYMSKDDAERHRADLILESEAAARTRAPDAGVGEKMAAWTVQNTMKLKRRLGMGTTAQVAASIRPVSALKKQLIKTRRDIQRKLNRIRRSRIEGEKMLSDNLQKIMSPLVESAAVKREELKNEIKRDVKKEMESELQEQQHHQQWMPEAASSRIQDHDIVDKEDEEEEEKRFPGRRSRVEFLPEYDDEVFEEQPPPPGAPDDEQALLPDYSQRSQAEIADELQDMNDYLNTTQEGQDYLSNLSELPRHYITLLTGSANECDLVSGVRLDPETQSWKLGIKTLKFDGDDLLIGDRLYPGTEGLYRLIFLRHPDKYTTEDLIDYKDILKFTRAHFDSYGRGRKITTGSEKYKHIIRTLFPPRKRTITKSAPQPQIRKPSVTTTTTTTKRTPTQPGTSSTGKGIGGDVAAGLLKQVNSSSTRIQYVPWNSINDLIDRLRLLYGSEASGNTAVRNEIVSIVSALREQ